MSKQRAVTLCGCLAVLPLLTGCADGLARPPQAYAPPSRAYAPPEPVATAAAATGGPRIYAIGPGEPAAILVMLPGPGDMLTADPRLWAAQGVDVMTPSPSQIYQIAVDRQAAVQLIAEAQALADAPVWLVGPNPAVEAAMASLPRSGPGQVSGVLVTSTISGAGTCSERMVYSYSGSGAPPKVSVSKTGDACPAGSPFGAGSNSTAAPAIPAVPPKAPRLIEASAPAGVGSRAAVKQVAGLIKSASSD